MLNPRSLYPHYGTLEGEMVVGQFDRKAVLELATSDLTVPFHARAKLLRDFKSALNLVGLPNEFYKILQDHSIVISGSFVPFFVDEEAQRRWLELGKPINDIDVYVGFGTMESILDELRLLPDTEFTSFVRIHPGPTVEDGGDDFLVVDVEEGPFYNNPAIASMVRLTLMNSDGVHCKMDIVESKSASPLLPILLFDLSHLRLALSADGLFEFHPEWHRFPDNATYASSRVQEIAQVGGGLHPGTVQFFRKYEQRGFRIVYPGSETETPGEPGHYCYGSPSCPLTLRSTVDDGVRFVPFTEVAAIRCLSEKPELLANPILFWCHGGGCLASVGAWEAAVAYEATEEEGGEQDTGEERRTESRESMDVSEDAKVEGADE